MLEGIKFIIFPFFILSFILSFISYSKEIWNSSFFTPKAFTWRVIVTLKFYVLEPYLLTSPHFYFLQLEVEQNTTKYYNNKRKNPLRDLFNNDSFSSSNDDQISLRQHKRDTQQLTFAKIRSIEKKYNK